MCPSSNTIGPVRDRSAAAHRSFTKEDSVSTIPAAEALPLAELITPTAHGIASRVLAKNAGGNLTLFAFDAGQGLTEHTSPFEAFVMVLHGAIALTVGGTDVTATPSTIVRLPANVPHALEATE